MTDYERIRKLVELKIQKEKEIERIVLEIRYLDKRKQEEVKYLQDKLIPKKRG